MTIRRKSVPWVTTKSKQHPDPGTRTGVRNNQRTLLRHVLHAVVTAHNGQVDPERDLHGRMTQPLADNVQRNPTGHQPMPSGTVPQAVSSRTSLPGPRGLQVEACRQNTELLPGTRVLMLTASNEQDAIVRAIAAGATGYLQKYSGKEQLLTTLREVAEGEFRIPGDAARRLARAVRSPSGDASERLEALTDREREILKLFAEGLTYQEIGEIRNNSGLTVRNAVSAVQRKLGFRTRHQMVLWAVRAGLVDGGSK